MAVLIVKFWQRAAQKPWRHSKVVWSRLSTTHPFVSHYRATLNRLNGGEGGWGSSWGPVWTLRTKITPSSSASCQKQEPQQLQMLSIRSQLLLIAVTYWDEIGLHALFSPSQATCVSMCNRLIKRNGRLMMITLQSCTWSFAFFS